MMGLGMTEPEEGPAPCHPLLGEGGMQDVEAGGAPCTAPLGEVCGQEKRKGEMGWQWMWNMELIGWTAG